MDIKNGLVRGFLKVIGGLWAGRIDTPVLAAERIEGKEINSIKSGISSLQATAVQLNNSLDMRMKNGGTLPENTNFDFVIVSGVYRFNSRTSYINPPPISWGQLLVIHSAGDTIAQLAFDYTSAQFYLRTGNPSSVGGSGKWTGWYKFTGTAV